MDFFQAIILGIVEGLTEFLPISSTAHQIIASRLLGISETDFVKTFIIAIQLGAIAAVIVLYRRRFFYDWQTNLKILTAFLPTAIIGFVLYKLIKNFLLDNTDIIAAALLVGGLILILIEYRVRPATITEVSQISYRQAFIIGCAQSLAVIPGVSRAGATIVGGLLMGIGREAVVTFSFLLAVPTMVAATGYDILKSSEGFAPGQFYILLIGGVAAFISALFAVKFFLKIIQSKSFTLFGIYRVVLGLAISFAYF